MRIKLTKGKFAIIDDEDFELISHRKWMYLKTGYAGYKTGKANGYKTYFMHRLINKTPEGLFTDHINRNKLDNRKSNLRTADKSLNGQNRGIQKNNSYGYKGVHLHLKSGLWVAELRCRGTRVVKYFKEMRDAIKARKQLEGVYFES